MAAVAGAKLQTIYPAAAALLEAGADRTSRPMQGIHRLQLSLDRLEAFNTAAIRTTATGSQVLVGHCDRVDGGRADGSQWPRRHLRGPHRRFAMRSMRGSAHPDPHRRAAVLHGAAGLAPARPGGDADSAAETGQRRTQTGVCSPPDATSVPGGTGWRGYSASASRPPRRRGRAASAARTCVSVLRRRRWR